MINQETIIDEVYWLDRLKYSKLINDFLAKKMNAEEFVNRFFNLYNNHDLKVKDICSDVEKIKNFRINSDLSSGIGDIIFELMQWCDVFSSDKEDFIIEDGYPSLYINENELREKVQNLLSSFNRYL